MTPALNTSTLPPSLTDPENYSYQQRDWRAPSIAAEDTVMFDEPGRVLGARGSAVDCRSHYFRVVKPQFGQYTLKVKHGGGEESWPLGFDSRIIDGLAQMDSDNRFRLLWTIMDGHHNTARQTTEKINAGWQRAAAEKRIKTRKLPGQNRVRVWIEPAIIRGPQPVTS
jgi:hypothetical protein